MTSDTSATLEELARGLWDTKEHATASDARDAREKVAAELAARGMIQSGERWMREARGDIERFEEIASECIDELSKDPSVLTAARTDPSLWKTAGDALVGRATQSIRSALAAIAMDAQEQGRGSGVALLMDQMSEQAGSNLAHSIQLRMRALVARQNLAGLAGAQGGKPLSNNDARPREDIAMAEARNGWKEIRALGEGGQGNTYLVERSPTTVDELAEGKGLLGASGIHVMKVLKRRDRLHRLRSEIEACARLTHPGILQIVDHDLDADEPWLVSKYCENGSLEEFWPADADPVAILNVFHAICDAVAHAHEKGIVHRDLKPENIFLDGSGNTVVGDFGICHIMDEPRFTQVNEPVGARHYIAPEAENGAVDNVLPSSDVYSLGKVLYWLTWKTSFAREVHRESGPFAKLTDSKSTFDHLVYEILDRTITKSADARFSDAGALRDFVDTQRARLLQHAHVVGPNAPQPCRYCGIGFYRRIVDPRSPKNHAVEVTEFGLGQLPHGAQWMITACTHCGNVQYFRLDKMNDPQRWHFDRQAR